MDVHSSFGSTIRGSCVIIARVNHHRRWQAMAQVYLAAALVAPLSGFEPLPSPQGKGHQIICVVHAHRSFGQVLYSLRERCPLAS